MSSTYCTSAVVEIVFGRRNVRVWADLDSDENVAAQDALIARGVAIAGEIIDSRMSTSRYTMPFEDKDGSVPTLIEEVAATLVGIYLYECRGETTFDPETGKTLHRYAHKRDWAYQMMDDIAEGRRVIDAR